MVKREKVVNDPNRKRIKGAVVPKVPPVVICMVCEKHFKRNELQLHHISKWCDTHKTTLEHSLVM